MSNYVPVEVALAVAAVVLLSLPWLAGKFRGVTMLLLIVTAIVLPVLFGWGGLLFTMAVGYFLPTLVAWSRRHYHTFQVFAINLFGGWSVIFWDRVTQIDRLLNE